jgi:hypothetical protein
MACSRTMSRELLTDTQRRSIARGRKGVAVAVGIETTLSDEWRVNQVTPRYNSNSGAGLRCGAGL